MNYNRILLKLSGESLQGNSKYGIDENRLMEYANEIAEIHKTGIEIAVVIGGGNIFRGLSGINKGFDRVLGDQMGMLATIINSIALQNALLSLSINVKLFTAVKIESIGERFNKTNVNEELKNKKVCILAGGTGNPFFSTDTASALRAAEIGADVFLKGTRVDGVYSDDPEKNPKAIRYTKITFNEVYKKGLKVMDLTAFTLCKENNIPVIVFDMNTKGNLNRVLTDKKIGTLITN
ncbi:MAG TPA: UMP kinase [Bacteroidales bacterium]|nr:UMP kinase [Bacteroidales bacterium]